MYHVMDGSEWKQSKVSRWFVFKNPGKHLLGNVLFLGDKQEITLAPVVPLCHTE